jgi:hypothetical protein
MVESKRCSVFGLGWQVVTPRKWGNLGSRMPIDRLCMQFYSLGHPRGPLFRKISLIWEIQVETAAEALIAAKR